MYRILTEDTHSRRVLNILKRYFQAFTLYRAIGVWKGQREKSLVIEISGARKADVMRAAKDIKEANHQQNVLVERIANSALLV